MDTLAKKLEAYYLSKGYYIDRQLNAVNIAYMEGSNGDGSANADKANEWNDRRIVFTYDANGQPYIVLNTSATTEPGLSATMSKKAERMGGVARVLFGQFRVWRRGFHKSNLNHPALVQVLPLQVTRDRNKDGKRTGDPISFATGINQHGTRQGKPPKEVGNYSEGCLVGQYWSMHLNFIELINNDPNFLKDQNHLFYTAVINGDEFAKFKP